MYCYTKVRNHDLCEQAIKTAADEKTAKYIYTYWLQTASTVSGQCMRDNIARFCFKLLLPMHAKHGIES